MIRPAEIEQVMTTNITHTVRSMIETFDVGIVISVSDFPIVSKSPNAVSLILNALVSEGVLCKLSKGRFYKPETGKSGELQPTTFQVIKDLLVKNGRLIGYMTGCSVFNDFKLTSQEPDIIQIGTRKEKRPTVRGNGLYRVHFVKQENIITEENIPLLRMLDCMRFFKTILGTTPDKACQRLLQLIQELDKQQIEEMKELALNYTPQAVALFGAILEVLYPNEDTNVLYQVLNPITDQGKRTKIK
jgi:predicted transcriptional regulator of viral defense system